MIKKQQPSSMPQRAWLDFNNADNAIIDESFSHDITLIKQRLLNRLPAVLSYLFPNGFVRGQQFFIGDVKGNRGKSLVVELEGQKAGMWIDFSTDAGGDIFDLWAHAKRFDIHADFHPLIKDVEQWLGGIDSTSGPSKHTQTENHRQAPIDDLGPHTGMWDYTDAQGHLLACVYRYDPPSGKEFRPWDVKTRKSQAPNPRPLYNQVAIARASHVVLVEGEKCADALIHAGIVATTAMNGAKAPIDKTDWSPLNNKHVVIWPDNDEAGHDYAQKAAQAILAAGANSIATLSIPADKPAKWDAADAIEDGIDPVHFLRENTPKPRPLIEHFTLGELLQDTSPIPDDLIGPRVLTPGGILVIGGAPKVGKSDFVLSWLTHMAAGETFLGMKPSRRLRIFYLQAEVQYHYLRERLQSMALPEVLVWRAADNLLITPQLNLVLNDQGLSLVQKELKKASQDEPIDVIVIDPLRNVFDGGDDSASENDNQAMLFFLRNRVEKLRQSINRDAGVIIVHHTKKITKRQLIEDPFLALSGAGSLRGYYTTGMLLYRPEESEAVRRLTFELRNGPGIPTKNLTKKSGRWVELAHESERLVNQTQGEKLDAERRRKQDVILDLLIEEAEKGCVYTARQFGEHFEGRGGLGAERTIRDRISVLTTKGYIKFFRDAKHYGLPKSGGSKYGYLCVEGMQVPYNQQASINDETTMLLVKPTHYKCRFSGTVLPVENPDVWVYQEVLQDEN